MDYEFRGALRMHQRSLDHSKSHPDLLQFSNPVSGLAQRNMITPITPVIAVTYVQIADSIPLYSVTAESMRPVN